MSSSTLNANIYLYVQHKNYYIVDNNSTDVYRAERVSYYGSENYEKKEAVEPPKNLESMLKFAIRPSFPAMNLFVKEVNLPVDFSVVQKQKVVRIENAAKPKKKNLLDLVA
jgi:hypothetical protein